MFKLITKPSFLLLISLIGFVLFNLGNRPFATPDEGRYVEIPREMVETGDWITPRLNGVKYFEKPALFYWMQATAIKMFGINEFSMRLWVAILAALTVIGVYRFVRYFESEHAAFFAGSILISSALFYALSRLIILDMPLTCFTALAMLSFFYAFHQDGLKRRFGFYGFAVCLALGVLTKGIVTLAIAGPVIVAWLSFNKQWGNLRPFYPFTAALILLLIAAPWHILASFANHDFVHKYFIVEHFERYTTTVHMRYQPVWYFVPIFLVGLLPWTLNLFHAQNLKRDVYDPYDIKSFLWIWLVWVIGFFSISNSKLIPYILPAFPPAAILLGRFFYDLYQENVELGVLKYLSAGFYGLVGIVGIALPCYVPDLFQDHETLIPYVYVLGGVFIMLGIVVALIRQNRHYIYSQYLLAIVVIVMVNVAAPEAQKTSVKPIAEYINNSLEKRRVVSFRTYFQDLPVYTHQRVIVAEASGELEFGMKAENTSEWMIAEEKLIERMKHEKFWIVAKRGAVEALRSRYKKIKFTEILSTKEIVLIKNN